jgi:hypothetical protein
MSKKAAIIFDAQVAKVGTLADGGLRIVFDLPETAIKQAGELMELKRDGVPVRVAVVPDGQA